MKTLYAPTALLDRSLFDDDPSEGFRWADQVEIDIDDDGNIDAIRPDIKQEDFHQDSIHVGGALLPGMANLHSHAHQRAMAGLAERAGDSDDSFWTWRNTMYQFLESIEPHHLHAIARQLYVEMLKAGYTRVAEFQYLHHDHKGRPYANIAEMSLQTLDAARSVGLGMTNLPVHYQFGGFAGQPIAAQQRRFANDPKRILDIVDELERASGADPNVVTGIAAHSLRAVTRETFTEVLSTLDSDRMRPVHIHIAEQVKEVEDCVAWSGQRPVAYLLDHFDVNHRWDLIHATHMDQGETQSLANSGAVAGLCPTTEGNLGDGFFNGTDYLNAGGALGIGSDSHISVSPTEELRWLEYGQRLVHRSRNQLSGGFNRSTGRNLFDLTVSGGAKACGHTSGAIAPGRRADFIVLDGDHPLLCERSGDELIDSWIFSGNTPCVKSVYVGGEEVIRDGHHVKEESTAATFRSTLAELRALQ